MRFNAGNSAEEGKTSCIFTERHRPLVETDPWLGDSEYHIHRGVGGLCAFVNSMFEYTCNVESVPNESKAAKLLKETLCLNI